MKKLLLSGLSIGVFTLTSCGPNGSSGTAPEGPRIHTSAQAERRVEPNMAKIVFAVLTRASTADKAREENAVKTTALIEKFKEMKIPEGDLETLDYRIQEIVNYQNGTQKIEAYEVVNRMQLKILDVKSVGKMVDQLVPLGANKIENVSFDVVEKDEIYKELLEEATALARDKAARMSEAAGLGRVTPIEVREETNFNPAPVYKYAMMESARGGDSSTQMAATATLKASVTLTAKAKE